MIHIAILDLHCHDYTRITIPTRISQFDNMFSELPLLSKKGRESTKKFLCSVQYLMFSCWLIPGSLLICPADVQAAEGPGKRPLAGIGLELAAL